MLVYWSTGLLYLPFHILQEKPCDETEWGYATKNNLALSFNILMVVINKLREL